MQGISKTPWTADGEVIIAADGTYVKPYHHDSWEGNRKWPSRDEQIKNSILMSLSPEFLEALEDIAYYDEETNNDLELCRIQWRGCVAIAQGLLDKLSELEKGDN